MLTRRKMAAPAPVAAATHVDRCPLSALALALLALTSFACGRVSAAGPVVVTTGSGAVQGLALPMARVWKGVPYALPPVGPLRWQNPEPITPWAGIKLTQAFGPACPQVPFFLLSSALLSPSLQAAVPLRCLEERPLVPFPSTNGSPVVSPGCRTATSRPSHASRSCTRTASPSTFTPRWSVAPGALARA